jgi:Mor family transcriptional regulator
MKKNTMIETISAAIGMEIGYVLCEQLGGARIYVPGAETMRGDNQIALVIGLENARILARHLGGPTTVYLPSFSVRALRRNEEIKKSRMAGNGIPHIAKEFDLTTRQVINILREVYE